MAISRIFVSQDAFHYARKLARSSAVAVIADRTAYDVRYTGKLSKQFRLQVYERLVCTIWFNGWSLWTHPNYVYSSMTIERDRPKFSNSLNNKT